MDRESTGYNITSPAILAGDLQKEKLELVFRQMIRRHESLRTSFEMVENEPVQKIHDQVEFEIEYHEAGREAQSAGRMASTVKNFVRPYDLSRAPLLRVGLITLDRREHLLIVDIHHIISDGASIGLLVKDFMALYGGGILPALKLQYKDFSVWQNGLLTSGGMQAAEEYWLSCLSGELPVLDLPTDYPRPAVQHFEGDTIGFTVGNRLYQKITGLIKSTGTTLYMVLLAVYNVLLARYTGQEDIVTGITTAARHHADQENIIGLLLETLAVRNYPIRGKTFGKFLAEVKARTLKDFEHQVYPFRELIVNTGYDREFSRNPFFDVMLIVQNLDAAELEIQGLKYTPLDYESKTAKVDLTLEAVESVELEKIDMQVEYSTVLFKRETIERFVLHFLELLGQVVNRPGISGIKLADLEIMTQQERGQILDKFNATAEEIDYTRDKLFCRQFEGQVKQTPNGVAVIGRGHCPGDRSGDAEVHPPGGTYGNNLQLTYRELNKVSNQLGYLLKSKGVTPDTIVGIMVDRSIDMLTGLLAILKAGGAYLPLDPAYPQDRVDYMMKDSGAGVWVSGKKWKSKIPIESKVIEIDSDKWRELGTANPANVNTPHDPAYIIYTSGSTGRPKG
jgi:fengycin family lipopeptide synthetase D